MQLRRIIALAAGLLMISLPVLAQDSSGAQKAKSDAGADSVSGSYKGTAHSDSIGDVPITVQIKNTGGKLSGTIGTPQGDATITEGTFADGKVSLKFDAGGNQGTVTAEVKEGKIVGNWEVSGVSGTLEVAKAEAPTPAPSTTETPAAATASPSASSTDPISGEWDGSADAAGTPIAFTLKLALSGGKISGESTSAMGTATISEGSFAGDKINFSLDIPQGKITFTGTLKEGKITGDYDIPGMGQGKWEASRKKT